MFQGERQRHGDLDSGRATGRDTSGEIVEK